MGWLTDLGHGISDVGDWVGNLWNDVTGKTAAQRATKAQTQGINQGMDFLQKEQPLNRSYLQPYLQYGPQGANSILNLLNSKQFNNASANAYDTTPRPAIKAFNYQEEPGYKYAQSQALDAAQKSAAAKGMLGSSNTLGTIQQNAGNVANQFYNDAFQRNQQSNKSLLDQYNTERNFGQSKYQNDLQHFLQQGQLGQMLAGFGQNAAVGETNLGNQYDENMVNLITGKGSANAQGALNQYANQAGAVKSAGELAKDAAALYFSYGASGVKK